MNTSASFQGGSSPFEFFKFDFKTLVSEKVPSLEDRFSDFPQPTQDADLLRQLSFIPGLKEILMLRQVHALEHATVWVLSESKSAYPGKGEPTNVQLDNELLGGLSTEQGFYLYGEVNISNLRRAIALARHRLTSGEWDLAVHPRCGTNLSVAMLLTAGLAVGVHLLLPFRPIEQLIGLGLAATTAAQLAPDLGYMTQRYLTTAIPFNLAIKNITRTRDPWGREAHFVKVDWQE
ncbi:MAG: DUF6391 domain-containing protein [Nostoc sp.]|uniref:DUF6391 domain-containing protein n=1 Tax=Nostoc sp. TaxID=1180 RepID=UPI002FFCECF1